MTVSLTPIRQEEPVGTDFWSSLSEFVGTYPWQIAAITIAVIAILVNIGSTRRMVQALELKRRR